MSFCLLQAVTFKQPFQLEFFFLQSLWSVCEGPSCHPEMEDMSCICFSVKLEHFQGQFRNIPLLSFPVFPSIFLKCFSLHISIPFFFLFTCSSLLCLALSCSDYSSILTERVEGWFFTLPILALKSYSFCNVRGYGKVGSLDDLHTISETCITEAKISLSLSL